MQLLQDAFLKDNFGLRKRFPWMSEGGWDDHIQTNIRSKERRYLNDLMSDIYDEDDRLHIERVENPYLWGRYILQYEEMKATHKSKHVQEYIMIHATSSENADKIAENNFDWRLVNRARFGKGVSFADDAKYARHRATRKSVFIVAGVLIANCIPGNWDQIIPEDGNDTTTGFTDEVCIKYYDNDFYPYYIVQ